MGQATRCARCAAGSASLSSCRSSRFPKYQLCGRISPSQPLGEVAWDEDQELSLLTEMGWAACEGSTCTCADSGGSSTAAAAVDGMAVDASDGDGGGSEGIGGNGNGSAVDAAVQLALEASFETAEVSGGEAAEAARVKALQLSESEWLAWETRKEAMLEERQVHASHAFERSTCCPYPSQCRLVPWLLIAAAAAAAEIRALRASDSASERL